MPTPLRRLALPILFAAAVAAGPAAAAELVVVEARGTPLAVGQVLDGARPIELPDGAKVTLVSADGTTTALKGPFSGAPERDQAAKGSRVVESLAKLVADRAPDTAALGTARAVGGPGGLPDASMVDATAAGNACVRQGQPVTLWRPVAVVEAELVLAAADRSWSRRAFWPTAETTLPLPADVPLADGQTVTMALDGPAVPVTVHLMPAALSTDAMRAAFMAARGCDRQLAVMYPPAKR